MNNEIIEIEENIISELKKNPALQYCNFFKTYDAGMSSEELEDFRDNLPGCLVSYIGDSFEEVTHGSSYMVRMEISVLVLAKKVRDISGEEKGTLSMLEDVKNVLHKSFLGGELDLPIILKDRSPLETDQAISIYSLVFEVQFQD